MSTLPIFWDSKFARFQDYNLTEIITSNGRKFLVNYQLHKDKISIPGRMTFGGFFPADQNAVTQNEITEVMKIFDSQYASGCNLAWKLPPSYFYRDIFDCQQEPPHSVKFSETIDINQHLEICNWKIQKMSKGNQKKYRQALKSKIIHKRATSEDVSKCYEVLSDNRASIGVEVSMSKLEMYNSLENFPDKYHMTYLELYGAVVAMSFTIDVAPKVRYVLYWADNLQFRNFSPIVLLCERLIEQANIDKIDVLDLGISSVYGTLNEGLYLFKQNLGAISCVKRTLTYCKN